MSKFEKAIIISRSNIPWDVLQFLTAHINDLYNDALSCFNLNLDIYTNTLQPTTGPL